MNDHTEKLDIGLPVVRVSFVDTLGGSPEVQFWAAACPLTEAIDTVRQHMPLNATVELTDIVLTHEQIRRLQMKPGTVREITDVGVDPELGNE